MAKKASKSSAKGPAIEVSLISEIGGSDLNDLCDAAEAAKSKSRGKEQEIATRTPASSNWAGTSKDGQRASRPLP